MLHVIVSYSIVNHESIEQKRVLPHEMHINEGLKHLADEIRLTLQNTDYIEIPIEQTAYIGPSLAVINTKHITAFVIEYNYYSEDKGQS